MEGSRSLKTSRSSRSTNVLLPAPDSLSPHNDNPQKKVILDDPTFQLFKHPALRHSPYIQRMGRTYNPLCYAGPPSTTQFSTHHQAFCPHSSRLPTYTSPSCPTSFLCLSSLCFSLPLSVCLQRAEDLLFLSFLPERVYTVPLPPPCILPYLVPPERKGTCVPPSLT